jgi:hypothetical protein
MVVVGVVVVSSGCGTYHFYHFSRVSSVPIGNCVMSAFASMIFLLVDVFGFGKTMRTSVVRLFIGVLLVITVPVLMVLYSASLIFNQQQRQAVLTIQRGIELEIQHATRSEGEKHARSGDMQQYVPHFLPDAIRTYEKGVPAVFFFRWSVPIKPGLFQTVLIASSTAILSVAAKSVFGKLVVP